MVFDVSHMSITVCYNFEFHDQTERQNQRKPNAKQQTIYWNWPQLFARSWIFTLSTKRSFYIHYEWIIYLIESIFFAIFWTNAGPKVTSGYNTLGSEIITLFLSPVIDPGTWIININFDNTLTIIITTCNLIHIPSFLPAIHNFQILLRDYSSLK